MNHHDTTVSKSAFRSNARAVRRAVATRSPGAARIAAAHAFREIALRNKVRSVSAYLPHESEIDPLPLMHLLIGEGYDVCVPAIEAALQPLRFKRWNPRARMSKGMHGIPVPLDGEWCVPDLLVVPLLAYDPDCFRLGYGGGYYDRTIQDLQRGGRVVTLGLAFGAQEVVNIPRDPWDMPLDCIATEAGLVRPRR